MIITATRVITLRSTSVGQPALLGQRRGEAVLSGIRKQPLVVPTISVGTTNIDGDAQADLKNHGGPNKAVYCYPADHLPHWRRTLGYEGDGVHAPLGENLSVSGITEEDACIGDTWRWGDVVLQ
ncbi:MOSC domain-containing protein, partial [Escherichia coli]|uniref:MOSC domain-containing protein n=1 Tax=Escherichia coli TaxID=562 RepID=UPI0015933C54